MIKVEFSTDKAGGSIILRLTGHAGAGEAGRDLVCSAASILAYTVAQTALFMYEDKALKKKPKIRLKPGDAEVVMTPKKASYTEALHTYYVAQVGYRLLAKDYPGYVKLTTFGESESS